MSFRGLSAGLLSAAAESEEPEAPRKKVLLIDDDRDVRRALDFVLRREMDIILAESAEEGISLLSAEILVAIVDIKMKGKDGFWAAEQIQRRFPHLPVIFHSGYQDAKDPIAIINEHRPFAFVTKGDSPDALVDAVRRALRHVEQLMQVQGVRDRLSDIADKMKKIVAARDR